MADDVRVRLSAEGVSEVVDAMKRIRDEAKRTGEEGGKAFEGFKEAISEVGKELIGFVAIGAVIEKTKELFSEVLNGAVQLDKLHRVTGLSTDALQAMSVAAKETNVSQESLNKGLEIFTRNVGLAENGSKKASQGFSELGIRVSELKNLSPDQQFQLIAEKLSDVDDKSRRAAIGSQLFGKSFLEIEPAIDEVSEQGFGKFLNKLKELGVYLDQDTIRQMRDAKIAAGEIGEELKGLASQFLTGLMPAATKAMDEIIKDTSGDGVNAFKTLGEWVGKVVDLIVTGFRIAGATVGYVAAQIDHAAHSGMDALKDLGGKAVNVTKYGLIGATMPNTTFKTSASYEAGKGAISDAYGDQLKKIIDDYNKPPEAPKAEDDKKRGGIVGGVDQNATAIGHARLAFIEAQLAAELKLFEAQSKLREDADKQAYEEGKLSLADYFKDRASILNDRFAGEVSILERRRAAIAALPVDTNDTGAGALQKQAQLATVDGEIAAKKFEQQAALATLATEQRQAQMKFYSDSLKAEEALYKIQGDKAAAAKLQLADQLRALDEQLKKGGVSEADRASALKTAADQGLAKINYDDAKKDADDTLKQLTADIQAIQDKVKDGTLFPVEGERQIIELEKQRLPVLQESAKTMTALADATKDAGNQAQASQFAQKVREIGIATDEAGQQMARLKQTAQDSFESGLASFLQNATNGTMTLGQAFQKMAFDIASSLAKLEAEFLAKQFVKWLNGDGQGGGAAGIAQTSSGSQGILGKIGGWIGSLFGGGGGGAGGAAASATTTANTTAVTANTAAETASTTATSALLASVTANTAALVANTAAVGASAGSSAGSGILSAVGSASSSSGHADGGHIRGPGSSTSDSIPAMLSDGEFVVNAAATAKPGVLALLHAINGTPGYTRGSAPGVRRYADGGAVAGGGMTVNHYHADASELPQHIIKQAVSEAVMNVIAGNPTKVRQSLG